MRKITIYTTEICPYCVRAKRLLKQKNVPFEEVDVTNDDALREQMIQKAGGRFTVPQIFADDEYVGDCDKIYALDRAGQLDPILNGA